RPAGKTKDNRPVPEAGEMVMIPGGTYKMGRDIGKEVPANETPAHEVSIKPFYLGRYEVTNKEYHEFVVNAKYRPPVGWNGTEVPPGTEDFPVANISWRDAVAYCDWLSKSNGGHFRLPSEEEWEYAARGRDNRLYPWGN